MCKALLSSFLLLKNLPDAGDVIAALSYYYWNEGTLRLTSHAAHKMNMYFYIYIGLLKEPLKSAVDPELSLRREKCQMSLKIYFTDISESKCCTGECRRAEVTRAVKDHGICQMDISPFFSFPSWIGLSIWSLKQKQKGWNSSCLFSAVIRNLNGNGATALFQCVNCI